MLFTSVEIARSPEEVKKVFFDFSSLRTWHTGIAKSIVPLSTSQTPFAVGEKVHIIFEGVPEIDVVITESTPTTLSWKGPPTLGIAGLHTYTFENSKVTPGGTTFVQKEVFDGYLAFLMQSWLVGKALYTGYMGFNEDLKKRCES